MITSQYKTIHGAQNLQRMIDAHAKRGWQAREVTPNGLGGYTVRFEPATVPPRPDQGAEHGSE
jgi:hypothetical protein